MNKAELIEALAARLGDRKTATAALDAVLAEVQQAVTKGDRVAITGFGVFEKRVRGARTARNPRTGEAVKVKKTSVPAFRAGAGFKEMVASGRVPKAAAAKKTTATASKATAAKKAPAKTTAAKTTRGQDDRGEGDRDQEGGSGQEDGHDRREEDDRGSHHRRGEEGPRQEGSRPQGALAQTRQGARRLVPAGALPSVARLPSAWTTGTMARVRRPLAATVPLALGILLLTDVLRVWLPSIITIFGQAASTPAELMGAFALLWFLAAFAAPPLSAPPDRARSRSPPPWSSPAAGSRCWAPAAASSSSTSPAPACSPACSGWPRRPQRVADPAPGHGVRPRAGHAGAHRGGHLRPDLARRCRSPGSLVALCALAFLAAQAADTDADADGGAAVWFVFGPILLLWGMIAGSPALAGAAISYAYGDFPGVGDAGPVGDLPVAVLIAVSSALFVVAALSGIRHRALLPAGVAALGLGVVAFAWIGPALLWTAMPLTAVGLGVVLDAAEPRGRRAGPARVRGHRRHDGVRGRRDPLLRRLRPRLPERLGAGGRRGARRS